MKGEDINYLKKYLSIGKSLKVCILDNNSIEFLTWIYGSISPEKIFMQYDIILIPQWAWVEVCGSENRKSLVEVFVRSYYVELDNGEVWAYQVGDSSENYSHSHYPLFLEPIISSILIELYLHFL